MPSFSQTFAPIVSKTVRTYPVSLESSAKTKDGVRVVVKVQHKDIDEIVRLDLKTIRRIMAIVQWFVPVQGLDAYYHQMEQSLRLTDWLQHGESDASPRESKT